MVGAHERERPIYMSMVEHMRRGELHGHVSWKENENYETVH